MQVIINFFFTLAKLMLSKLQIEELKSEIVSLFHTFLGNNFILYINLIYIVYNILLMNV